MFVDNFLAADGSAMSHGDALGEFSRAGFDWDPGMRRPYFDKNGNPSVTINTGRWTTERGERKPLREHRLIRDVVNNLGYVPPVFNATTLRKEEWIMLDSQVLKATRYRLQAWGDLMAANSFGGFNGMSKMMLEHETMADPGEAIVDMNGITEGRSDVPRFQLEGLPLPITHSDFFTDARKLAISRNTGTPLDTTMGEAAGRRVAESIEKTTIGNQTGVTYGGGSSTPTYSRTAAVYGYLNFPTRITKTNLTTPTGSNPEATVADILSMKDSLALKKFYGPFTIYHSNDWDQYMDNDYARLGGDNASMTLRDRIRKIEGINDVKRLDMLFSVAPQTNQYWTSSTIGTTGQQIYTGPGGENLNVASGASANPFTLIMVQMTPDVARAVNGMDITTVQWEQKGGMQLNFKVMAIQVPQLRADFYGNCGILHASTS